MRVTSLMAGFALVLAACGGEKAADQQTTADQQPATETATPAPATDAATTGTAHDVNMVLEGTEYKFVPEQLTVKAGDVVRYHNVSGGPHNVQFYADSIPEGAAAVMDANMKDRMGPLAGPLIVEPNAVYEVSYAGAPAGEYRYTCLPHMAMGMNGMVTVTE